MVNYRRNKEAGGLYFFTVTLSDRRSVLLIKYIKILEQAMGVVKAAKPYSTKAYVVLPDHLHVIWQLPEGDSDYATRWRQIKSHFTRNVILLEPSIQKDKRGEYSLWQRRYWEHTIRDERDFESHFNYIHYNPIKHGKVKRVVDWEHSSFHYYVAKGVLPRSWGDCVERKYDKFGE